MKKILLCTLLLSSSALAVQEQSWFDGNILLQIKNRVLSQLTSLGSISAEARPAPSKTVSPFEAFLHQKAPEMRLPVIEKVSKVFACAQTFGNDSPILTVIDYSLPSNQKRLWIFDLRKKALLFHTHVSHGLNSGARMTDFFSNTNNSKASSLGVYRTGAAYYGREGMSLRLEGLDKGFNDEANNRYIVMHGGWYVEAPFIQKYGRAGRSWGCPALPLLYSKDIIQTIKENNLLVVYYPDNAWFAQSKYLNCDAQSFLTPFKWKHTGIPPYPKRAPVLFTSMPFSRNPEENQLVMVVSADHYQKHFNKPVPLNRMLRRQIAEREYIALSPKELNQLIASHPDGGEPRFVGIHFVTPVIKMVRGYYETLMQIRDLGEIEDIKRVVASGKAASVPIYQVQLKNKPNLTLTPNHHFVRWLGL